MAGNDEIEREGVARADDGLVHEDAPMGEPQEPHGPDSALLAPTELLAEVRLLVEAELAALRAKPEEQDAIATEVVGYVDFHWRHLRLYALSQHSEAWHRHIANQAVRRWLLEVRAAQQRRGSWATPIKDPEQTARQLMMMRADAADVGGLDREILDSIYVFGFSVEATARRFGLSREETVRRLRAAWAKVRRQFPELFGNEEAPD